MRLPFVERRVAALQVAMIFSAGVVFAAPPAGVAQTKTLLEEVTVTAQKREESVQDVPIAINALQGDQLESLGVSTTDDMMKVFPNLILKPGSAINTGFSIRGVGSDNFHVTQQQAVGQYLDEVSLISPFVGNFGLFDMERIEVLRGPQNTLFGRNTTGGAVNMISRKPEIGGELNGYARVNLGNEDRRDFEGAVGIPLGDTMAARVALQSKNRGGIFKNLVNGDDIGDEERHSGRIQLAWEPTEATQILVNGHVGISRSDRLPFKGIGILDADNVSPCPLLSTGTSQFEGLNSCVSNTFAGAPVNISTPEWEDVLDAAPNVADIDFYGTFLRITHDFESFTLTSITSYDTVEVQYQENTGGQSFAGFFPGQDAEYEAWSQEVRLVSTHDGPWRWIVGGFYSNEDDTLATIIRNNSPGTPPFSVIPSIEIQQEVDIWSFYGQIDIDVSDRLILSGGVRWTDDSKEGISIARIAAGTVDGTPATPRLPDTFYTSLARLRALTAPAAAAGIGCPGALPCQSPDLPVEQSITEIGGKISASLYFTDDVMGYASIARGFKSGAFDTRALAAFAGTADRPVGPEFLMAYEIGVKSELFDGAMQFNAAAFKYNWEDLQIFDVDATGLPAFLNVPRTEIVGAEAEIKWVPAETWFIQFGLGLLDSEIVDAGGLLTVAEGAALNHTPDVTFNGLIIKEFQIGEGTLAVQTDFQYSDEFNSSLNDDPDTVTDETFFINARASYTFGSEREYEVSVWGQNLSEEKTCYDISNNGPLTFENGCTQNPGMAFYGASFQYNF